MQRVAPLLCFILAGCSIFDVFGSESPLERLHHNRDLWQDLRIANYDFEFTSVCFCAPSTPVRIEVRAGRIARIVSLPSGEDVTPQPFERWPTIDSLFLWTERSFSNGYKLDIDYDATYRFPARVDGDIPGTIDDEFVHTTKNFVRR